jgi:hypothetical protein
VGHTPSTSSSQDQLSSAPSQSLTSHLTVNLGVLSSLHTHNYKITKEWILSFLTSVLTNLPPPDHLPPVRLPSNQPPTDLLPPNPALMSNEHGLQMLLETPSISDFKFISKHTWSWPPSLSPILLGYGLLVHLKVPMVAVCGNSGALMAANGNLWERAVLARRSALEEGERLQRGTQPWGTTWIGCIYAGPARVCEEPNKLWESVKAQQNQFSSIITITTYSSHYARVLSACKLIIFKYIQSLRQIIHTIL